MKRLGVFISLSIFAVGLITSFDTPRAFAQSADSIVERGALPSQGSYESFQAIVTTFHTTALKAMDDALLGRQNDPNYAIQQKATADFKAAAQKNYTAYLDVLNTEKGKGTQPADAQIKATQAWIASAATFNHNTYTSSPQKSAYAQYATLVQNANFAAVQIKNGTITAGSPDEAALTNAQTIANAAAGNTNTSKLAQDDASKCKLFSSSLIECVDALVSWIIKNTLLQIAGFLVWLTANLLNYSIQTGILEFRSWAPDTLYPLWVIVRQIISLIVVFAGLYLGFMYIIGREDKFQKYVGWLVLFALFVNFSYPVTRAIIDVSNIVSLNIYASAVGSESLIGNGDKSAGTMIMGRLGLQTLVAKATETQSAQSGFISGINSTPGALIAVAFVFYAAYVFFMATAIIAVRTAILIFLTIASPLLLVDAVVPKLGEAASRMRKMFFEQLIVAPVFMIMLALTLKFMEIFQAAGTIASPQNTQQALQLSGGGAENIKIFFGVLMMLIMLHITLKVTKHIAGEAGTYATNFMGKVGGFGLGVASGGFGMLGRGTIGNVAARARDSGWMDKLQGSRMGRGLYGFSNSLAQSTYDTRNIGAVSKGLAKAGLTGGLGVTSQQGLKQNSDQRLASKQQEFTDKFKKIKDTGARQAYLTQTKNDILSPLTRAAFGKSGGDLITKKAIEGRAKTFEMYKSITDQGKKKAYYLEHKDEIESYMQDDGKENIGAIKPANNEETKARVTQQPVNQTPIAKEASSASSQQASSWAGKGDVENTTAQDRKRATIEAKERAQTASWTGKGDFENVTAEQRKKAAMEAEERARKEKEGEFSLETEEEAVARTGTPSRAPEDATSTPLYQREKITIPASDRQKAYENLQKTMEVQSNQNLRNAFEEKGVTMKNMQFDSFASHVKNLGKNEKNHA